MKVLIAIIIGVVIIWVGASLILRQDTSSPGTVKKGNLRDMEGQFSFGLDVCDEIGKDLVTKVIKKLIVDTKDFSTSTNTGCQFITNSSTGDFVAVYVEYSNAENIKNGQQSLGRKIETNSKIGINHFIAMQADGEINAIYLVMTNKKYVRVDRTGGSGVSSEQMIELASQVADKILYE